MARRKKYKKKVKIVNRTRFAIFSLLILILIVLVIKSILSAINNRMDARADGKTYNESYSYTSRVEGESRKRKILKANTMTS